MLHPNILWPHCSRALQRLQHDWGDEYICRRQPVQTHSQASRPGPAAFLTLFLPSTKSILLASMPSAAQLIHCDRAVGASRSCCP